MGMISPDKITDILAKFDIHNPSVNLENEGSVIGTTIKWQGWSSILKNDVSLSIIFAQSAKFGFSDGSLGMVYSGQMNIRLYGFVPRFTRLVGDLFNEFNASHQLNFIKANDNSVYCEIGIREVNDNNISDYLNRALNDIFNSEVGLLLFEVRMAGM